MHRLKGIKFLGDLSLEDADLLVHYGKRSPRILEFGVGGSTQIFAQCNPHILISVDTSADWVSRTQDRLDMIEVKTDPVFYPYDDFLNMENKPMFDLILVDGIDTLRRDFAEKTWHLLSEHGVMIFHDTRRAQDFLNVAWVAHLFHNEISEIKVNEHASNGKSSNITVIYKKTLEPYVNWNLTENKPLWAYGDINYDGPLWQLS